MHGFLGCSIPRRGRYTHDFIISGYSIVLWRKKSMDVLHMLLTLTISGMYSSVPLRETLGRYTHAFDFNIWDMVFHLEKKKHLEETFMLFWDVVFHVEKENSMEVHT